MEAIPGMISLVAGTAIIAQFSRRDSELGRLSTSCNLGKPNPNTFPFAKISITLKGEEDAPLVLEESSLRDALQYGLPSGHPRLVEV
jgi:hypothetical protein